MTIETLRAIAQIGFIMSCIVAVLSIILTHNNNNNRTNY